jgi:carbon monoxide dehydrogenase subunit G
MSYPGEQGLLVKSAVKQNYSINANHDDVFEYLSDTKRLLVNIPYVSRIQLLKSKGLARLYCNMPVLTFKVNSVVDIEAKINHQNRLISFHRPATPIDTRPEGYIVGTFKANIEINPKENGDTKISSTIILGFDSDQFELLKIFPNSFLETAGQKMLQDFVEKTSQNYITKLASDFPKWLKQGKSTS